MNAILKKLREIQARPSLYLAQPTLALLKSFIDGYALRDYELTGNSDYAMRDYWGRLFSLGRNDLGQCGNGKSSSFLKKPELIMGHTLQAAVGHHHGIGLQENGNLWIWGGDYGVLADH